MQSILTILILLALLALLPAEPGFREDFRDDVAAHIPVTSDDLTSDFLTLQRLGPGADKLKLSYHPEIENDPHYVWNGECAGPTLLAFDFQEKLDLSSPLWHAHIGSKNVGKSKLHLALKVGKQWFVRKAPLSNKNEWNSQTLALSKSTWLTLAPDTMTIGNETQTPDFKETTAIGFASPHKPNRSKDCTRLNWFELTQSPSPSEKAPSLPPNGFLEPDTPFLRSALVFEHEGEEHIVRRGVIVPLHHKNRWACFDPDTLQWVAVWEAPAGKAPLTYDSMAGVSFPDKKAKAKRAPRLRGKVLFTFPLEERAHLEATSSLESDQRRWLGITLHANTAVLHYELGSTTKHEFVASIPDALFPLVTKTQFSEKNALSGLSVLNTFDASGKRDPQPFLGQFPESQSNTTPPFPQNYLTAKTTSVNSPNSPFTTQPIPFPLSSRPIRATDLAFLSNGTALLATLDGDIWQIKDLESDQSTWTRVATGLFEPMAIEVTSDDKAFTLGRDQITELIDTNGDGHIDHFRNASDVFQQTLHTRDYATSLAIAPDGSFLIAKGGLFEPEKKEIENELSEHRGTIIHITPDGLTATVLADGLRLPYVGLRKDGAVFASDQQGNHIPSTPIHLISGDKPFLGFEPTNFQKNKTVTEPLLWYPYQANRSAAAFSTTSTQAFPDLPETFLQVSWDGRLFAIETPEKGQPFSWKLPLQLDFPALTAATHPQSGRLYTVGLGISGYLPTTPNLVGLASLEQTTPFPTPQTLEVSENSITVTFNRPLTETESITPGNPNLRLFNVKRTPKYGSGHYLWNDEPGEHQFAAKTFQLSPDRQTFQATFDSLHRSDIFDLQLNISTAKTTFPIHLYTRPQHLTPASESDLRKIALAQEDKPKLKRGQPARGKPLFTKYACAGCHALNNDQLTGPPLNGVAKRLNRDKLRQSILEPTAEITEGFEPAMPSFEGVIPPQDLEHLLSYLETLR